MVNGQLQQSAGSRYRNENAMYLMFKVLMAAVHWLRRLCDDRRTNGHLYLLKHPPSLWEGAGRQLSKPADMIMKEMNPRLQLWWCV